MAINFSLRDFYDGTTEIVGIKSGLLLNRFQVAKILLEKFDEKYLKSDDLDTYVRIHSGDLEEMLLRIRQKIGNLPENLPSRKAFEYLQEYSIKNKDITVAATAASIGFQYLNSNNELTIEDLTKLIHKNEGYDKELSYAVAVISHEKFDQSCIIPSSIGWDGGTELSKLYNCELKSENNFLEQKFIDYLAANGDEIEIIHWRNFERFCAEYFKKQGYNVVLGPGTNDGGVDIRAYIENNKNSAPELLIQCKRYKKENKISIETVKSFYTDVQFEQAKLGLIATTSYIAAGGKKVCKTRGYNVKFAERENIKNWAKQMWTHK
ncbi:restriction endonuclease [Chitinophaga sp.]|uniref:restriction endonuclease n=1 Tax=Chitinophaga sp. TaxID=1869181 RepID=UPI0031D40744